MGDDAPERRLVARRPEDRERHRQPPFARVHAARGLQQELVEVRGHGPLETALERNHARRRLARLHRLHHLPDAPERHELLALAGEVAGGLVREGALRPEVGEVGHAAILPDHAAARSRATTASRIACTWSGSYRT